MSRFYSTPEQAEYVREIAPGRYNQEIAEMFNEKFGTNITWRTIKSIKLHRGIRSGVRGSNSTAGRFEPGRPSHNILPIGTVSYRKDRGEGRVGYYYIKVAEPNVWELYHKWLWVHEHGEIPEGHVVFFIDGNSKNCVIENLDCVPKRVHLILNRMGMTDDADINKVLIAQAKLSRAMYDKGATKLNKWRKPSCKRIV